MSAQDNSFLNRLLEWLAVPSWVIPGTVAQNATFLATKVKEVALCCFEYAASLKYNEQDLPLNLAALPLNWHVHLPLDLPWEKSPEEVAAICLCLREKLLFLHPHSFVLHYPLTSNPKVALEKFANIWYRENGERLLIENDTECYSQDYEFLSHCGFGYCLDIAHGLRSQKDQLVDSFLPEVASMVHWSAPCGTDAHKSLALLSKTEFLWCRKLAKRLSPNVIHVLEIFDWKQIISSLPALSLILFQDKE